ncbi:MAG TPA: Hsp20/alpha crystallin family protein [Planctomycetota bacterium]|nr:Hsp20/alpha crystallin family protein [Planctomycetota bacterium]
MTLMERKEAAPTRSDTELTRQARQFVPDVDIYETEDSLMLIADMPGVKADRLNVRLEKSILTIHGEVGTPDVGERNLIGAEYETGNYYRAFTLSEEIDQDRIEANLKNGVLTLRLPKAARAKARRIQVAAE